MAAYTMPGMRASMPKVACARDDGLQVDDGQVFADVAELVGSLQPDGALLRSGGSRRHTDEFAIRQLAL